MGSFNVTCQVTGHTIGPNTATVGFFLKPQADQEDQSHRPDEPLKSMFAQWLPVNLPVHSLYDDVGQMLSTKEASPLAIKHTQEKLGGFDYSEKEWDRNPVADRDSKYIHWQIRSDVFQYLVDLGQQHPEGLLPINRSTLEAVFSDVDSTEPEYREVINFFAGLNILGYGFREYPSNPDQSAANDHERLNPLRERMLCAKETGLGPVAELPGVGILRCGFTGRPLRVHEELIVFPLVAREAKDFDNTGRLSRISNFGMSAHYELCGTYISAHINEDGSIWSDYADTQEMTDCTIKDLLMGYSKPETKYREVRKHQRMSAMAVSKSAFDLCHDSAMNRVPELFDEGLSVSEMLSIDLNDMRRALDKGRRAFVSKDVEQIKELLENYDLEMLADKRLLELNDPKRRDVRAYMLSMHFMEALKNLSGTCTEFYRSNAISNLINSSRSPLDIGCIIPLNQGFLDYLWDPSKDASDIDASMSFLEETVIAKITFSYLGIGLRPTEPCHVGVSPDITLSAWENLERSTLQAVDRELAAWIEEMED